MAASMISNSFSRTFLRLLSQSSHKAPIKNVKFIAVNKTGSVLKHVRLLSTLSNHHVLDDSLRRDGFSVRNFRVTSRASGEIREVQTPPFADSISEGDVQFQKEVGDSVTEDEVVAEVETEKTSIPVPAPVAGVITEFCVENGSTIQAGTVLYKIEVGAVGKKPAAPKEEPAVPKEEPAAAPPPAAKSPAAGAIPSTPPPAPPRPTAPLSSTPAASVKVTPAQPSQVPQTGARTESRIKMNRMRLSIGNRLKDAQNTCAMLTTFNEIDMSNIMQLRSQYKEAFMKKHNLKLGFMSAFVKASAYALQDMPVVNAVIDESEIVYRDYVDISVAVATPKGLLVPVLRNVEAMNYANIEQALSELATKARDNAIAIEDMVGGTFTISNGGVYGSMFGTPIINPPQSAILGMHGIFERPVAINGKVEVRPMMYVALTYDHRLIDGREGVTFLRKIKSAVEDPRIMFLDL